MICKKSLKSEKCVFQLDNDISECSNRHEHSGAPYTGRQLCLVAARLEERSRVDRLKLSCQRGWLYLAAIDGIQAFKLKKRPLRKSSMPSLPSYMVRCRTGSAMVLAGLAALCIGTGTARSQLIPSATGAQSFLSADTPLAVGGTQNISIAGIVANSGSYDANGVVYLTNGGTASTVTAQYFVNNLAQGPAFSVALGANGTTTLAIPQQFTAQFSNVPVRLQISNGATGSTVTLGAGSGMTLTGYSVNGDGPTATLPGSANLAANVAVPPNPANPLTIASVGGTSATGLFSLNSAVTVINTAASSQTITGRYTVDTVAQGPTFQMTLPAGNGSTTVMSLPSQISLAAGSTHTFGIQISDVSGLGMTIKSGSTLSVTPYNTSGGTASAVGISGTVANQAITTAALGNPTPTNLQVTVPTTSNNTLWDAAASLMIFNNDASLRTLQAQYSVNGTGVGTLFNVTLPASGVATLFMPEQFAAAALTAGTPLGILFTGNNASGINFTLEAGSISLVAHQQVPTVGVPEPASMSLAAMAAMAFGAAAWRKRRSAKVPA
jgi:hypothetical protein